MTTLELRKNELLIVDPCYITNVTARNDDTPRFDALVRVKTLHDGDDGVYVVKYGDEEHELGVDSGRLWVMKPESGCKVELDAGHSGYITTEAELDTIELVND